MDSIFKICFFLFLILPWKSVYSANNWSEVELKTANTAVDVDYMNDTEKEIIQYLNLARLYPKRYIELEVNISPGNDHYKTSLISHLKSIRSMGPLIPDKSLKIMAECLLKEQEISGEVGHKRNNCLGRPYECCSYGLSSGKAIALSLLIDRGVPSYGHRKIILKPNLRYAGVAFGSKHPTYRNFAVIDFK